MNSYGMLTGYEILKQINSGDIIVDPFNLNQINPNSYNVRLHPQLLVYTRHNDRSYLDPNSSQYDPSSVNYIYNSHIRVPLEPLDMKKDNPTKEIIIPESGYTLYPGVLYIGRTIERTASDKFIPMINGRSSGGRLGISVHVCAGFGDIGFDGTWTLEITVVEPLIIYPNVEIAQVCWFTPAGNVEQLYNGKYNNQEDATASRLFTDRSVN